MTAFMQETQNFGGLLIMITSRVNLLHESIRSHMNLVLAFPSLDTSARRLLWRMSLNDLRESETSKISLDEDLDDLSDRLAEPHLNGHQIRNHLASAVALARYDSDSDSSHANLRFEHFEIVLSASASFSNYAQASAVALGDAYDYRAARKRAVREEQVPSPQDARLDGQDSAIEPNSEVESLQLECKQLAQKIKRIQERVDMLS
jgi:hypothetical protein